MTSNINTVLIFNELKIQLDMRNKKDWQHHLIQVLLLEHLTQTKRDHSHGDKWEYLQNSE